SAADKQSGLGHAIAGVERFAAKAALSKTFGEATQHICSDALGAAVGLTPAIEIQTHTIFRRYTGATQIIGECGTTADGGAITGDRRQPAQRVGSKSHRRQKVIMYSTV